VTPALAAVVKASRALTVPAKAVPNRFIMLPVSFYDSFVSMHDGIFLLRTGSSCPPNTALVI
jgi:hypothetical protein